MLFRSQLPYRSNHKWRITLSKFIGAILAGMGLIFSSTANAAANCGGSVSHMITYSNGDLMILGAWRADWTVICNVNDERQSVKPATCFTWFSEISSSITENKTVSLYYPSITQPECATMPTYSASPVPSYVMIIK